MQARLIRGMHVGELLSLSTTWTTQREIVESDHHSPRLNYNSGVKSLATLVRWCRAEPDSP